jgi:hypothetical protein
MEVVQDRYGQAYGVESQNGGLITLRCLEWFNGGKDHRYYKPVGRTVQKAAEEVSGMRRLVGAIGLIKHGKPLGEELSYLGWLLAKKEGLEDPYSTEMMVGKMADHLCDEIPASKEKISARVREHFNVPTGLLHGMLKTALRKVREDIESIGEKEDDPYKEYYLRGGSVLSISTGFDNRIVCARIGNEVLPEYEGLFIDDVLQPSDRHLCTIWFLTEPTCKVCRVQELAEGTKCPHYGSDFCQTPIN